MHGVDFMDQQTYYKSTKLHILIHSRKMKMMLKQHVFFLYGL